MIKKSKKIQLNIVIDVIIWIDNNLNKTLTIDSISRKAGYSRWYFQKLFKYITGVSLGHYVSARRLSDAAIELKLSNKKIIDISEKYGFRSQPTFSRAFKKFFKKSPKEYRCNASWTLNYFTPPYVKDEKKIIIYSLMTDNKIDKWKLPDSTVLSGVGA